MFQENQVFKLLSRVPVVVIHQQLCNTTIRNSSSSKMMYKALPVVFCGPSGVGKSTLVKQLRSEFPTAFGFSVSHTTRKPREGEVSGKDYHFVTRDVMEQSIKNGDFIENAEFSGNLYGTSKKAVEDVQAHGKICILDIDVQGVRAIKNTDLNPRLIFVSPPSFESLKTRLENRGTETGESLAKRLAAAKSELDYGMTPGNFDIIIVNDDLDVAYKQLKTFILPDITKLQEFQKQEAVGGGGDRC